MKNKSLRLIFGCMALTLFFGSVNPTFAKPGNEASEKTIEMQLADETDESTEDTEFEEAATEVEPELSSVDENNYITSTKKSDENNVQITFHCTIPEGFTLGAYVDLEHEETGNVYRILATSTNQYYGRMFVPNGQYHVLAIGIAGDDSSKYPMIKPDDFYVNTHSAYTLESTFSYYEEIAKEAEQRLEQLKKTSEDELAEDQTRLEDRVKDLASNNNTDMEASYPWRKVGHKGTGTGIVSYKGVSQTVSDYIIEITTSGKPKHGEFRYSSDNGATWSDVQVIQEFELITTDTKKPTGLTLKFDSQGEFVEGDQYTFYTNYEYKLSNDNIPFGEGVVRLYSEEKVMDANYKFKLKIRKTGPNGQGMFAYSLNGKTFSEDILIPEDGQFNIPNTVLKITFYDVPGKFVVNDTYKCAIEGEMTKKDYTFIYIIFGALVAAAAAGGFFWLLNMKEKPYEYTLNTYEKVILPKRKK